MGQTTLVYTAIPDATYPGPGLRLAVAISPRLDGPAGSTLADHFELVDWPARLESMWFEVEINGMTMPAQLSPPRRTIETRDLSLWQRIFPFDCPVHPWAFVDQRSRTLQPYPATLIDQRLRDVYGTVARAGTEVPRVLDVGDLSHCVVDDPAVPPHHDPAAPPPWCDVPGYTPNIVDHLLLDTEAALAAMNEPWRAASLSAAARVLYDGLRYYDRRGNPGPAPSDPPLFDVHQRAALLGDHPVLQRACGLVFDLTIPVEVWGIPPMGEVRVRPRWRGWDNPRDLCPATFYDTTGGRFRAGGWGNLVAEGYLALDRGEFSTIQLDTDGGLLQIASTMASVRRMLTNPHCAPEHEQTLPAMRSGGVTLLHRDRPAWLAQRFDRQSFFNDQPQWAILGAEDLLRGLRIDILVDGSWRSLHRRHGDINNPAGQPVFTIPEGQDDEGFVKIASGSSTPDRPQDLYLHEAVAGWSGWSLSARRPGETIVFDPDAIDPETGERSPEQVVPDRNHAGRSPIETEYEATPRTLPRLRFGQHYRLRARAVDLAGGSLPVGDLNAAHATQPFRYQRWEPIPGPVVVPRTRIVEAESNAHMVVRTDPLGARSYTVLRNERHFLAPKGSLDLWEKYGKLEGAFSSFQDMHYHLAARERGTLTEPFIIDRTGANVPVTDRRLCNSPSKPEPFATSWPRRGEPLEDGQYVISEGDRVRIPWLPDPAAGGVALWDPRTPGSVTRRRFQPRPDAGSDEVDHETDSLLVVLHAAAPGTPPTIAPGSEDSREIHVLLAPGDRLDLRCASYPHQTWLDSMALWDMLTAADRVLWEPAIRNGQHWMFTPASTLTLVHAVQRPVEPPRFDGPVTVARVEGEGRAQFVASIGAHTHSTSHVDVRARWLEVNDDATTGATETFVESDVCRVAFAYDDTVVPVAQATEIIERLPRTTSLGPLLAIRRRTEGRNTYHELPDGKRRIVEYTPIGTTRWQEYFPLHVIADPVDTQLSNLQARGPTRGVSVPASVRPAPPAVVQMLPTYRRQGTSRAKTRQGNAVRIYLERPWFTSGAGERLAILLEREQVLPPQPTPADWLEKVSRWAADPVWSRPAPNPQPLSIASFVIDPGDTVGSFGGVESRPRVEVVRSAQLDGNPVDAIVVAPQFSQDRQQWYCDVELTGLTYAPFLSLALARYQEHSVPGLGLSGVVRAEMVQLAPDRSATIIPATRTVRVVVRGISAGNLHEPQHAAAPGGAHRIRARVEIPSGGGTELDWKRFQPNQPPPPPLAAVWASADEVEWSGTLAIPRTGPWRVRIEESEVYAGDERGGTGVTSAERISYVEILTPS